MYVGPGTDHALLLPIIISDPCNLDVPTKLPQNRTLMALKLSLDEMYSLDLKIQIFCIELLINLKKTVTAKYNQLVYGYCRKTTNSELICTKIRRKQ